jgi:hypothetical protein
MSQPSIIINYCSNEKMFLDSVLTECNKFSNDIVVSFGSHLYDGTPENKEEIDQYKTKYRNVKFVEYDVDVSMPNNLRMGVDKRPTAYFHNLGRWTAYKALKQKDWVFVIDCDEIPEGDLMKEWWDIYGNRLNKDVCLKFACHWYFKSVENQAIQIEDSILLIHYDKFNENTVFGDMERDHLIQMSGCELLRQVMFNKKPIWHHFSFVRSKDGLKHKLKNWGHSNDIFKNVDIDRLVESIFESDVVNDFVHGYSYKRVENRFKISVD